MLTKLGKQLKGSLNGGADSKNTFPILDYLKNSGKQYNFESKLKRRVAEAL